MASPAPTAIDRAFGKLLSHAEAVTSRQSEGAPPRKTTEIIQRPAKTSAGVARGRHAFHSRTRRAFQRRPIHGIPNRSATARGSRALTTPITYRRCRTPLNPVRGTSNGSIRIRTLLSAFTAEDPSSFRMAKESSEVVRPPFMMRCGNCVSVREPVEPVLHDGYSGATRDLVEFEPDA